MKPVKKPKVRDFHSIVYEMWKSGATAKTISDRIKLGRGAILAYIGRHLGHLRQGEAQNSVPTSKGVPEFYRNNRNERIRLAKVQSTNEARTMPITEPEPELLGIPLLETHYGQCRWIEGEDDKCCGHQVYRGAYCKHHYQRCYLGTYKV